MRTLKTAETQAAMAHQQEEFRTTYESVLREKNDIKLELQAAQLEERKAKFIISQLQD